MSAPAYRVDIGDCRDSLRAMAERGERVQMCVTSPPYFGLRDYGNEGQIGLEQTPEEYIAAMVEVFRCVRDVLADDGTLWLNIGDSYANDTMGQGGKSAKQSSNRGTEHSMTEAERYRGIPDGLKRKDLIGIPWLLAFALRADGWYLRQDIIWHKPNPMPESVRDRCTKAHEYIFLLSKSERYFFDSEAMREPAVTDDRPRTTWAERKAFEPSRRGDPGASGHVTTTGSMASREGRNRRSVWTVATRPYKGAHFATFPPALIEPCILAGSRPGDTVLDPFGGSGTTAGVAIAHGRNAVLCELNPEYSGLTADRVDSILAGYGKPAKPKRAPKAADQYPSLFSTIAA